MKKIKQIALLSSLTLLVGCASFYAGVVTITSVVDSAMKQWSALSVAGKTSATLDKQVIAAHDKYRASCAIVQASLITYKNTGDQTSYVQALSAAKVAASGVIDLITPFIVKSEATKLKTNLVKANTI